MVKLQKMYAEVQDRVLAIKSSENGFEGGVLQLEKTIRVWKNVHVESEKSLKAGSDDKVIVEQKL